MALFIRQARPVFDIAVASAVGVAERWATQYPARDYPGERQEITKRLREMGDKADPDEVAKVIGNKTWTHPSCGSCGQDVKRAVVFNRYDTELFVCEACMESASAALSSTDGKI